MHDTNHSEVSLHHTSIREDKYLKGKVSGILAHLYGNPPSKLAASPWIL
jgi:hypothetical protein